MHHVYLIPGMFGFARLAGYEYFGHLTRALQRRYDEVGQQVHVDVIPMPPTSSIRSRSRLLTQTLDRLNSQGSSPIHLVGHSTGGLDIRLALAESAGAGPWRRRVRSAVSLNTPHYGTPLATYFTTVAGARVLYVISLLTVLSLSLGEPTLALASRALSNVGRLDQMLGDDLRLFRRVTDALLKYFDKSSRNELITYMNQLRRDQGALIQTTPEAMDLFNASLPAPKDVRLGAVASAAIPATWRQLGTRMLSPYDSVAATLFRSIARITGEPHAEYPYASLSEAQRSAIERRLAMKLTPETNDGVVPTESMVFGELLWAGPGDHLDIIGHFHDSLRPSVHLDWMPSRAGFGRKEFAELVERVVTFQLG